MTNDIDAIRQREQAATPGPWWSDDSEQSWRLHGVAFRLPPPWKGAPEQVMNKQILKAPKASEQFEPYWPDAADAEFIAHARTDVPALLAKVDELTAERDQLAAYNRSVKGANADLRAERTELTAALAERDAQLTAANRRADGAEADQRALIADKTALANENARLRSKLADADLVISSMRDAIDEADTEAATR